jgi:hypothetical protein
MLVLSIIQREFGIRVFLWLLWAAKPPITTTKGCYSRLKETVCERK